MNSKYAKLSIIVAYAPTDTSQEEDKDEFYEALQSTLENIPAHDVLLTIGDFNAKIGNNNENRKRVMGKHGMGIITNNGERLINICQENNLVIGGSLFTHRDIHKLTWTSPDGNTKSQIDHIIINGKWRHSLLDVRVKRNADIGSDHNLLVAKVKIKLRKAKIASVTNQRIAIEKLKDQATRTNYCTTLRNRFNVLQNDTAMTIDSFNNTILETAKECIGFRKKIRKEWMTENTWNAIEERKRIRNRMLNAKSPRLKERFQIEYREKDKEIKSSARRDKKTHTEHLTEEAQNAASKGDLNTLYKITRTLSGRQRPSQDLPIKKSDGTVITEERAKLDRWKQHFQQVLNRPTPQELANISDAEEDLDISLNPISLDEITRAIKKQKNNKAPGEDGICAEMIKAEETITPKILQQIFQKIWDTEDIPISWKKGLIVKLPKKGDLSDSNNWRGITLLSITSKVFSRIILSRISEAIDEILRQEQAGFRKGKSCIDQIFVLRQILEQSYEWSTPLYNTFIDFEKAFDSLHRPTLWKILRHYGIPEKIVNIIRCLYENFECKVIHNNLLTDSFTIDTGVKQGCLLSPILFSLAIDWIMHRVTDGKHTGLQWTLTKTLEDLDYADDLDLLSNSHQDIQAKSDLLVTTASKIGLKVNTKKTKLLRINSGNNTPVIINGKQIEEVEEFSYLGSMITSDADIGKEINTRINKATQAFAMLKTIWRSSTINNKTKIKIFKSNVLSVL